MSSGGDQRPMQAPGQITMEKTYMYNNRSVTKKTTPSLEILPTNFFVNLFHLGTVSLAVREHSPLLR